MDLTISINTVSGKIIAGMVNFNAIQSTSFTLPLKRCSDKAATVALSVSFSKVNKIKDIEG